MTLLLFTAIAHLTCSKLLSTVWPRELWIMSTAPIVANGHRDPSIAGEKRWRNDSEAGWVVQKFGGTSVGKFAGNIAEDIVR